MFKRLSLQKRVRTNQNLIKNRFRLNFTRKYKNVSTLTNSYLFFKFLDSSRDFYDVCINHRARQNVGHFPYASCSIWAVDYLHLTESQKQITTQSLLTYVPSIKK